jgi:chromosome partitioning protein
MSKIICLANQKGGVAKSTTAINMAAFLGLKDYKVLVIDFDPQGNASSFLGVNIDDPELNTSGSWITGESGFKETVIETKFKNLFIIPSNDVLKQAEIKIESDRIQSLRYLEKSLTEIKDQYDVIIIDTLPSFGTLFINALVAAAHVIIPAKLETGSLFGVKNLIENILKIESNFHGLEILGLLGTFYRAGVKECDKSFDELVVAFGDKVFETKINLTSKIAEAAGYGEPVAYYDTRNKGYEDYNNFVDEVIERLKIAKSVTACETVSHLSVGRQEAIDEVRK